VRAISPKALVPVTGIAVVIAKPSQASLSLSWEAGIITGIAKPPIAHLSPRLELLL
jgi:hypothetical protein